MRRNLKLNYQDALDYIYSYTDYEVKPQHRYSPDVMDPDRPARLLALLDNPHQKYPTIHIAGTKGKGSVAAICASALQAAGLVTGLYTSPHLQDFRERIQVDNQPITEKDLVALVNDMRPVIDRVEGITTFEVITALAFVYFAQRQVDVAVIEVGLGGRLDATNVLNPLVSIITSLSYDHTYLLGDTLAAIAAEKAGIIQPGVPVVSADQEKEAMDVLVRIAEEKHAPLTVVGRDWWYELNGHGLDGQSFLAGRRGMPGERYQLPLLGSHQTHNATVARAALEIIRDSGRLPALDERAIKDGLAAVNWPGRFQILDRRPLVVVDGAHNVDAVIKLRATLEEFFGDRRIILIFGATADKDVPQMIDALLPVADEIVVTAADHPRATPAEELASGLDLHGFPACMAVDVTRALEMAYQLAGPDDVICATGSLFVVGDILRAWERRQAEDTHVPESYKIAPVEAS